MPFNRLLIPVIALTLTAAPCRAQDPAPAEPAGLADALALAQGAYAARDWPALRDALTAAESFAPAHPLVLFHLARAEALTGNADAALRRLRHLARSGGSERDIAADSAFIPLRSHADFAAVHRLLREAAAPIVAGDTAFVLPDPDFIPEGIAYDPRSGSFFVGSLHRGQIVRIGRDGAASVAHPDAAGASDGRRGQVLGLRVDSARNVLWAATLVIDSAAPRFRRGPGGWAALRAFDLASGRLVASHAPPDPASPHLLNDIALAPNGDVYVTDSEGGALFRLPNGGTALERVHGGSPRFIYPNGVAVDARRGRIFVAHVEGISSFALGVEGPVQPVQLAAPVGAPTSGIDGLYVCGGSLLAIQSLLDAQQVSVLGLDADGAGVTAVTALERKHPEHQVATTGVVVGDALYYVAGSQLPRLQPDGSVHPAQGAPRYSVVLRLPLQGACDGR